MDFKSTHLIVILWMLYKIRNDTFQENGDAIK